MITYRNYDNIETKKILVCEFQGYAQFKCDQKNVDLLTISCHKKFVIPQNSFLGPPYT